MAYKQQQTSSEEWRAIEARELFCKAVNSMLMTNPKKPLKKALDASKRIVDTAFEYYPVPEPKEEQVATAQPTAQLEFPIKKKAKPKETKKSDVKKETAEFIEKHKKGFKDLAKS